jgi:hypothetical protein
VEEVEIVARVCRKWDEDGIPDQEASDLGELILKVGDGWATCWAAPLLVEHT